MMGQEPLNLALNQQKAVCIRIEATSQALTLMIDSTTFNRNGEMANKRQSH